MENHLHAALRESLYLFLHSSWAMSSLFCLLMSKLMLRLGITWAELPWLVNLGVDNDTGKWEEAGVIYSPRRRRSRPAWRCSGRSACAPHPACCDCQHCTHTHTKAGDQQLNWLEMMFSIRTVLRDQLQAAGLWYNKVLVYLVDKKVSLCVKILWNHEALIEVLVWLPPRSTPT